jgi:PilZ domain-containing protein
MASERERRRSERYPTASIPVQLSEIAGELVDLSVQGAAVVHRSPIRPGSECTLIFPSHGGFYIPCHVLRSVVQVRRGNSAPEYVFRSAIQFNPIPPEQEPSLKEFLQIQIGKLQQERDKAAAAAAE